jgi:hypothetical protein
MTLSPARLNAAGERLTPLAGAWPIAKSQHGSHGGQPK